MDPLNVLVQVRMRTGVHKGEIRGFKRRIAEHLIKTKAAERVTAEEIAAYESAVEEGEAPPAPKWMKPQEA